jgi:hypothetical protein
MQYKSIVLDRIQSHPFLHDQLRQARQLLAAVNHCSMTLKTRHEELTRLLGEKSPGRNSDQLTREAFEIALEEFESRLPTRQDQDTLSLDAAMAFVLGRSQTA